MGLLTTVQREKEEFNEKVVTMRDRKKALITELTTIADKVTAIQRERLHRSSWKEVPRVPSLATDEEERDPLEVCGLRITVVMNLSQLFGALFGIDIVR